MQYIDGDMVLSPSDLCASLSCDHLTSLEVACAVTGKRPDLSRDPVAELLAARGDAHERAHLEHLRSTGCTIIEVRTTDSLAVPTINSLHAREAATVEAMRSGADVIYQATFFDGVWRGHADFLRRVDTPSKLGDYSYEVIDTKLNRHATVEAVVQIAHYSGEVARLQGVTPQRMHLQLGDNSTATFLVRDFVAYLHFAKRQFHTFVKQLQKAEHDSHTYPVPVAHCSMCDWSSHCEQRRIDDDHLSLVARMRRRHIAALNAAGITTGEALANADPDTRVRSLNQHTFRELHQQARLQYLGRQTDSPLYELLPQTGDKSQGPRGLGLLPVPSPGDLFFDMEGDPHFGTHGIEYLFGVVHVADDTPQFHAFWGHDATEEQRAFEAFIDFACERLRRDPDMHIYHYAPYETTRMKQLAGRYNTRQDDVDDLLRRHVFVDLYAVVRQAIRISQGSYSIKKLEPFYMEARNTDVVSGGDSVLQYERWRETGESSILDDIAAYNRDDCISTWKLRDWLEDRRHEYESQEGIALPRPDPDGVERSEAPEAPQREQVRLVRNSLQIRSKQLESTGDRDAMQLLSHLLEWHRREKNAFWWRYFDLTAMTDAQLFEDPEALSRIEHVGQVGIVGRSVIDRYSYPPQDHKLFPQTTVRDPITQVSAGTVIAIDQDACTIDVKHKPPSIHGHPRALIPFASYSTHAHEQALLDVGTWVSTHGLDAPGRYRCVRDLLLRQPPRLLAGSSFAEMVRTATSCTQLARDTARQLDDGLLAIQGPPGAGKTYTGAEIVLDLIQSGKQVGITATSHKVIDNLLSAVAAHASVHNVSVTLAHKCNSDSPPSSEAIERLDSNEDVLNALANGTHVIGGTSWLFSREEFRERFDVLIVDEAGQMSLADVVAVGTSARSLILLGDPLQLAQPSQGVHPDGAGASALEHFLGENQTMPASLGILLDRTWRMHPDICTFVSHTYYEDLLFSEDSCAAQRVIHRDDNGSDPSPLLQLGTGLRHVPVDHVGRRSSSPEEAHVISEMIQTLIGECWVDRHGVQRTITRDDILIITPYNAQVVVLGSALPAGSRIGTVDKFQGQEAAVVFYSLAASSSEDVSHGIEFLLNPNRFNVAISRARCLAFVVYSPELLNHRCTNPNQVRLLNNLCRLTSHQV